MKKIPLLGALCAFAVNAASAAYSPPAATFAPVQANITAGAHLGELAENITIAAGKKLTLNGTLDATNATLLGLSGNNGGSLSGNLVGNVSIPAGLRMYVADGGNLAVSGNGTLFLGLGSLVNAVAGSTVNLISANVSFAAPEDAVRQPWAPATAGWVASNFISTSGATLTFTVLQNSRLEDDVQLGPGNITTFGANLTTDATSSWDLTNATVALGNVTLGGNRVGWVTGGNANITVPAGNFTLATVANITGRALTGNVGASGLTMTNATILGRYAGSTGNIQLLTLGSNLTLSGTGVLDTLGSFAALNAGNLTTGTVPTARLGSGTANSSTVLYGNQTFGVLPVTSLSALNASNLTTGTVATARLASGTANSSTVLYGNQTWGTISGGSSSPGGADTQVQFNNAGSFAGNYGLAFTNASGYSTLAVTSNTSNGGSSLHLAGSADDFSLVVGGATQTDVPHQLAVYNTQTNQYMLRLANTGNLALGPVISLPTARLDVAGAVHVAGNTTMDGVLTLNGTNGRMLISNTDAAGFSMFEMQGTGTNAQHISMGLANGNQTFFGGMANKFFLYDWGSNSMRFVVEPASGNFGINTNTPAYKLDVGGTARVDGNVTALQQIYAGEVITGNFTNTPSVVFVGDSLTSGFGSTGNNTGYDSYITMPAWQGLAWTTHNVGIAGEYAWQMGDKIWYNVSPYYHVYAGLNLIVLWGGTNDQAVNGDSAGQALSYLWDTANRLRRLGWKVMVLTMISRQEGGADASKNTFNGLVRTQWPNFADALCDVAADPVIGADGAYANTTVFSNDHVHLNDTGYARVGAMVQANITSFLNAVGDRTVAGNFTANGKGNITGNLTVGGNITMNGGTTNWAITGSNSTAIQLTINGTTKYINFDQ